MIAIAIAKLRHIPFLPSISLSGFVLLLRALAQPLVFFPVRKMVGRIPKLRLVVPDLRVVACTSA